MTKCVLDSVTNDLIVVERILCQILANQKPASWCSNWMSDRIEKRIYFRIISFIRFKVGV